MASQDKTVKSSRAYDCKDKNLLQFLKLNGLGTVFDLEEKENKFKYYERKEYEYTHFIEFEESLEEQFQLDFLDGFEQGSFKTNILLQKLKNWPNRARYIRVRANGRNEVATMMAITQGKGDLL